MTMSETVLFPQFLAPYVLYIGCLITVSITFMMMHGLQLMTLTTALERWHLPSHTGL